LPLIDASDWEAEIALAAIRTPNRRYTAARDIWSSKFSRPFEPIPSETREANEEAKSP
jgi:hypothetical protein